MIIASAQSAARDRRAGHTRWRGREGAANGLQGIEDTLDPPDRIRCIPRLWVGIGALKRLCSHVGESNIGIILAVTIYGLVDRAVDVAVLPALAAARGIKQVLPHRRFDICQQHGCSLLYIM